MLSIASVALHWVYILLPALSLATMSRKFKPFRRLAVGGWLSGAVLGIILSGVYVFAMNGQIDWRQGLLAAYFGIALLLLLRGTDVVLKSLLFRVFGPNKSKRMNGRLALAALLRVAILGALSLGWVMSAVMVYRPRVVPRDTPRTMFQVAYDDVTFPAADGGRVGAWFIGAEGASETTVLLVHGLAGNKAGSWAMMDALRRSNVNVLAIDLRAHGQSGGQLTTFGLRESSDVLGAVEWLKSRHPTESQRIIAVGASIGGAAVVGAAARDARIDAVAVLGSFDSLAGLTEDVARTHFVEPIRSLVRYVMLPIASLHVGVDLRSLKPADDITRLWPRPVLVVHGTSDDIIPFARGQSLYKAASLPKSSMWPAGTHNAILEDADVIRRVVEFAQSASPSPVI